MTIRRRRIILIASLLASGVMLGGCSTFDPTEWFNTKKPLPGDRKSMFPDGVPGVPQGVPPELVEGYREPEPPPPQVVEEKAKPKPKPRPKQAAAPRAAPQQQQQQQQQQAGSGQSQSVFPEPPRR
jgi:outer membrane biosynthesis protein TonB